MRRRTTQLPLRSWCAAVHGAIRAKRITWCTLALSLACSKLSLNRLLFLHWENHSSVDRAVRNIIRLYRESTATKQQA